MLNRPFAGAKFDTLTGCVSGRNSLILKTLRACALGQPARLKDKEDDGKGSDDLARLCRARGRVEAAPVGGAPAHHRAYRRSALAWRPFGERGISRREGRTVA